MSDGLDLGKQVGPLPLGGWVAVVGGGLAIAYFINRNQPADPEQLTESGVGQGGSGLVPIDFGNSDDNEDDAVEETNASWAKKAADWLIAQGHDPATSNNAVQKYITGLGLSFQENALINLALVRYGAPPEPIAPTEPPKLPEEDDDDLSLNPGDDPQITVDGPTSVQRKKSVRFTGRAWFQNRTTPSGARRVKITVWNSNYRPGLVPLSTYYVLTDEGGRFKTTLGWTNPDRRNKYRYYTFSWSGAKKTRRVRII